VTETTPAEAQRLLAAEFERQGWEYDLTVGREIAQRAERSGVVDAAGLARLAPREFLDRNSATREDIAGAIERALGGRAVRKDERPTSIVINNQTYQVDLAGAQITRSNMNIGPGTQVNVDASGGKEDVLTAVATVVAAGLAGDWNAEAVRELGAAVAARDDIAVEDIEQATADAVEAQQPNQGRVREMLRQIAVSGAAGLLTTGVSAALGGVLPHLPI
jgi:hypothetical protein